MKLSDFQYEVPEELVAQYPLEKRDASQLMVLNKKTGERENKVFPEILDFLNKGDVLVVNETKVFPARLFGTKDKTEATVELLLLRQLEKTMWEVLVKPARKVRVGNRIQITDDFGCDVIDNTTSGAWFVLTITETTFLNYSTRWVFHLCRPISTAKRKSLTKLNIKPFMPIK